MTGPDLWLAGIDAIDVRDEASASQVREEVRRLARAAGLAGVAAEELAAAASELVHNQLRHARDGRVAVRTVARGGVPGVEVVAADRGDGIADPAGALRGGPRPSGSLGVGLGAAARLSHEMDVEVRRGEGTCVRVRRFAAAVERSEVGVLSRASRGEEVCGDDGLCLRDGDELVLAIADGLGHGAPARAASAAAMASVRVDAAPLDHLAIWEAALQDTRGAVAGMARMPAGEGPLRFAGAGNVGLLLYQASGVRKLSGTPRVLGGGRSGGKRPAEEQVALEARRTVLLFTDGISSRADLSDEPEIMLQPPIVVAQRLVERFARADDDVLVIAAR